MKTHVGAGATSDVHPFDHLFHLKLSNNYRVLFFQCILSVHVNLSDNSYSGL